VTFYRKNAQFVQFPRLKSCCLYSHSKTEVLIPFSDLSSITNEFRCFILHYPINSEGVRRRSCEY